MHYCAEVLLPNTEENRKAVEAYGSDNSLQNILEPILEPFGGSKRAFYDYWVIGGRWTGNHDNYNPYEDVANMESCSLCNGSGVRSDLSLNDSYKGCNGCSGRGVKVKWDLKPHKGDALPLSKIRDDITCYTLIIHSPKLKKAKVFHKEEWDGNTFVKTDFDGSHIKEFLKEHKVTDGFLITLDYHN